MTTTLEQFQTCLDAPEGTRLEFKSAIGGFHFEELIKYCVALANEGGGKILLGISDKRPRQVLGTQAFHEPGRTEAGLFDRLHRRIPVEEYRHEGKRVLIVHVPGRNPGEAWQCDGRFWMRAGDALVPMTSEQLRLIHAEGEPDFSALACPAARLTDLDPKALAEFRSRWSKKSANPRILNWSDEQTLADAELMAEGKLTYAALILCGSRPALGRHLAAAEVIFEYRSSEAAGPAQERHEFREGLLSFHDSLWELINKRNDRQSYQDGFFRFELPTFDEMPAREAVLNAICHRDYRSICSVFVRQFARRVEVISPGGLPNGITVANILEQQQPRNRRLAEAFAKCGLVERAGQGMNLIYEQAIRHSKPLPDFTGTSPREVRLTLHGNVTNPAFVRFLEKVGAERLAAFSTFDLLVLDHLQQGHPVPPGLRSRMPGLMEAGIVETVGRGRGTRYLLSKGFYQELGQKGTYTRKRGLDKQTNKELLVKHIQDNGKTGSPLAELQQVLPHISESHVQRLLCELREEGRVCLRGHRRWAKWFATPESAKAQNHDSNSKSGP